MKVRTLSSLAQETSSQLLRGPIFLPAVFLSLLLAVFAGLASSWTVSDFRKILFDIGIFSFQIMGSFIAMFWSLRILSLTRIDGSLEVQLASPISRSLWLIGRFLGVSYALFISGMIMLVIWQISMLLNDFGWLKASETMALTLNIVAWWVVAAMTLVFTVFCGMATALFAACSLWIVGLMSEALAQSMVHEDSVALSTFFSNLSKIWNLQNFSRSPSFFVEHGSYAFVLTVALGLSLVALFLSLACVLFSKTKSTASSTF